MIRSRKWLGSKEDCRRMVVLFLKIKSHISAKGNSEENVSAQSERRLFAVHYAKGNVTSLHHAFPEYLQKEPIRPHYTCKECLTIAINFPRLPSVSTLWNQTLPNSRELTPESIRLDRAIKIIMKISLYPIVFVLSFVVYEGRWAMSVEFMHSKVSGWPSHNHRRSFAFLLIHCLLKVSDVEG